MRLEATHRRVAVQHVVAHLRVGHRTAHRGGGLCDGVASQVDRVAQGFFAWFAALLSLGDFTSTVGTLTSVFFVPTTGRFTMSVSFVVPTVGVLIVSVFVPTSTDGVWIVSVCVPTTGFSTWYSPSPVFLHAPNVAASATVISTLRKDASR